MTATSDLVAAAVASEIGPNQADVMAKARDENFSVASRLVPKRERSGLLAVYGYARLVDDVGDLAEGDREAQLDSVEAELDRAYGGSATHPVFVELAATIEQFGLAREPFSDLIAANRLDQKKHRYGTYEELLGYCELSANPVGRLVLSIFGRLDDATAELSDRVCTGLQLVEHWQDVAEDYAAGRIYLPACDLQRFEVVEADLGQRETSPSLRRLMAFEVTRARRLLEDGSPLVARLTGAARIAIAGFVGGGLAQLAAVERAGYDVLGRRIKANKTKVALQSLAVLIGSGQSR